MSWIRDRPAEDVRRDALLMAGRKLAEGCGPCAEAYLDLALRHGATEAEISQARRTSPAASGQPDVP